MERAVTWLPLEVKLAWAGGICVVPISDDWFQLQYLAAFSVSFTWFPVLLT